MQKQKKLQQELDALRQSKKMLRLDISSLEEKIPEAIRGNYCFSAEKLSSLLAEKEQSAIALQEQEKVLHEKLQQTENEKKKQMTEEFTAPDWKREFQTADIAAKQMLLFHLIDKITVKDGDISISLKI